MLVKLCLLPGLHEIAAGILKHLGLDDENALDFGLFIFHNLEILCTDTAKKSFNGNFKFLLFVYMEKMP